MDEHDKGIALPEESEVGKKDTYRRRGRVLTAILRRGECRNWESGMTVAQIAKEMREPHSITGRALDQIVARNEAATATEEGEKRWWIPKAQLKAQMDKLAKQCEVASRFFRDWTLASIRSREAMGILTKASYPYVLAPEESSSLTTTPLT